MPSTKKLQEFGISETTANSIVEMLDEGLKTNSPEQCWQKISKDLLRPDMPFGLHKLLFESIFSDTEGSGGPHPAWFPTQEIIEDANVTRIRKTLGISTYEELLHWSGCNRLEFWELMVDTLNIRFKKKYDNIVKFTDLPAEASAQAGSIETPHWLSGAEFNIIDSCFQSDPEATAIIYQPEGGKIARLTYKELEILTNKVANGLTELGFKKGDAIAIDMVMTVEAAIIYLGIVKAGCIVVSIADSLAPAEVQKRLKISAAKAVFTQDVIMRSGKEIPLYEKLLTIHPPKTVVLPAVDKIRVKLRDGDLSWDDFLSDNTQFDSVSCASRDICNILFSSGTTGDPKAIPWTHTTPIKCAADGYLHQDIHEGDVVAWPTNLGWMMGPWLIFASLINKATIALFHGAPLGSEFGKFIQDAKVNMLGVVPALVRRWIETDCMNGLDWSNIKVFSSTGECSNAQNYLWLMSRAGYKPIIEYCGGTEIGGGYITGTVVRPAAPSTFTTPALGLDFVILDENGKECPHGELYLVPPSIGLSNSLLNKDHHKVYYEGTPEIYEALTGASGTPVNTQLKKTGLKPVLRRHGDEVERISKNYFRTHGRADDTMNLGGIKVGSAEIERVLDLTEDVSETAAIAVDPPQGGPSRLVIYAVLQNNNPARAGEITAEELISRFQKAIKNKLNPLFKVFDVKIVTALPRTASNKVMRRVLRNEYSS
ncbi:AMP-binding protein [bacterium AH-315-M05]|nr:AMP-binding protein [bacterium AH-315-M05]